MMVGILVSTVLPWRFARAQAQFQFWNNCPTVVSQPEASSLGVRADLCNRYTFVRGRSSANGSELLYLIANLSKPIQLRGLQPLVFVDVDSPSPTLHFAVSAGQAQPGDVVVLRLLRRAIGSGFDFPLPYFGLLNHETEVELLVEAGFFALAERLGLYLPERDGTTVFSALAVAHVPELNLLVFSAALTEAGRAFFRAFVDQGIGGLDALLSWRVRHRFGSELEVAAVGWFPCVRAGLKIVDPAQLREIDPVLLTLPINLNNVTQLVRCP